VFEGLCGSHENTESWTTTYGLWHGLVIWLWWQLSTAVKSAGFTNYYINWRITYVVLSLYLACDSCYVVSKINHLRHGFFPETEC
jgi:hypothetical protein